MFWALALILLGLAACPLLVLRRRPAGRGGLDTDQLQGFAYVGAGALTVLSVVVVLLGLFDGGQGVAETVAVLGLFAYGLYLAAAGLILTLTHRRR